MGSNIFTELYVVVSMVNRPACETETLGKRLQRLHKRPKSVFDTIQTDRPTIVTLPGVTWKPRTLPNPFLNDKYCRLIDRSTNQRPWERCTRLKIWFRVQIQVKSMDTFLLIMFTAFYLKIFDECFLHESFRFVDLIPSRDKTWLISTLFTFLLNWSEHDILWVR